MCTSTLAAGDIQIQRLHQNKPGLPSVKESDRRFRFADGRIHEAQKILEQPITYGLFAGRSIKMHLIDRDGNETSPLFSIDDMRRLRMVVDYEESKFMLKDNTNTVLPGTSHELPVTERGTGDAPIG